MSININLSDGKLISYFKGFEVKSLLTINGAIKVPPIKDITKGNISKVVFENNKKLSVDKICVMILSGDKNINDDGKLKRKAGKIEPLKPFIDKYKTIYLLNDPNKKMKIQILENVKIKFVSTYGIMIEYKNSFIYIAKTMIAGITDPQGYKRKPVSDFKAYNPEWRDMSENKNTYLQRNKVYLIKLLDGYSYIGKVIHISKFLFVIQDKHNSQLTIYHHAVESFEELKKKA